MADEVVIIEESTDEVEPGTEKAGDHHSENEEDQENYVIDLTKNLINKTVQSVIEEQKANALRQSLASSAPATAKTTEPA